MARIRASAILTTIALTVFLSGCTKCELQVTNRTGGSIQFYTGHTKKAVQIQAGATRTVPHASGRVIIIGCQDQVWEYEDIDVGSSKDTIRKSSWRMTLPITVESDGSIVLPSGEKVQPTRVMKPTS